MMAEPATPLFQSLEDFLTWEEQQAERYEMLPSGVIRLMAGGTGDHDAVAMNIVAALHPQLRRGGCIVHGANLKVRASTANAVVYPDVFVRCGAPTGNLTSVDDPVVVFEVLSEGTSRDDLTRKRLVYKSIPTVKVIVYVSPDQYRLDIVRRGPDGRFDDDVLEGSEELLELPEISARLPMNEIYENTSLAAEAEAGEAS